MNVSDSLPPAIRIPVTGLLSWFLPGLGHVFVGQRNRGLIIMMTVAATFWGGIAVGGVRITVDSQRKKLWFFAQICAGAHAVVAHVAGQRSRVGTTEDQLVVDRWQSVEIGVVYTGVAGLLSVLVILDALARAESSSAVTVVAAAKPGGT